MAECDSDSERQRFEFGTTAVEKEKITFVPLNILEWQDRQNRWREWDLKSARADVDETLKRIQKQDNDNVGTRRAVVFYIPPGEGFLLFLKWWIYTWKAIELNALEQAFDIVLMTHPGGWANFSCSTDGHY